jgi:sugar lactone lactonase YvrE
MGWIFVAGEPGKAATGLHIDRWGRLWAAGAGTGEVRVFDARNGKLLQTYTFGPGRCLSTTLISRATAWSLPTR